MRTYYFDTKDGFPVRDNKGMDFTRASEAIKHSKRLAAGKRKSATATSLSSLPMDQERKFIESPVYVAGAG
ncbi:hypothetical protein [Bradyrhizobium sp.]|uniref:hypothetical protein n=1 Tax=Bradyrhizobium sp. TaxID=376 RepID=UPI00342137C9